jgi:hypothetical protein
MATTSCSFTVLGTGPQDFGERGIMNSYVVKDFMSFLKGIEVSGIQYQLLESGRKIDINIDPNDYRGRHFKMLGEYEQEYGYDVVTHTFSSVCFTAADGVVMIADEFIRKVIHVNEAVEDGVTFEEKFGLDESTYFLDDCQLFSAFVHPISEFVTFTGTGGFMIEGLTTRDEY